MRSTILSIVGALAIALPVSASLSPRAPGSQGTTLRPIAIRDYEAAAGLQRRENSEDFSDLDTKTQAELIYGSPGDNGQLLLANMTLYAEDGLEIVMMERFEGLTSAVDCQGNGDGKLSLTFSSQNAYEYALKQWAFINDSDNGKFLLITNHDGCGPDNERQPYIISKITEDNAARTTTLDAKAAPWEDVTGTYDLDFGHITPYQHTTQLNKRFDISKTVTVDVSAGKPGQVSNIYSDSKFKLDCINCFTTGSFALTGHISTSFFSLKALTLTAAPRNFQAELELEAKINAGISPASLQYEKELFSFPIPGAGITIPHIFSLGATLAYDVGITTTFQGTGTVDFGVSAGVPDSARLTADVKHQDLSSATGFGGGSLTPLFDVKDMSASVKLGAYSKPKLALGLDINAIGHADVDISVKLPEVDVTLTAAYNQAGVCTGNPSTTGIKLDSTLDIEVDLDITAKLGSDISPSWSKPLFSTTEPIASQCFPLQIPGLVHLGPSSTAIPSAPTTLASTQPPSITPTHVYSASGASVAPIVNGTSYIIAPSGASVPHSLTAPSGTPGLSSTGYIIGPSGISGSGTGSIPRSSSNPPYPYSSGASGAATATGTSFPSASTGRGPYPFSSGSSLPSKATGTGYSPSPSGYAPSSSGSIFASGVPASSSSLSTGVSPSNPLTSPSASGTDTAPVASGTSAILRRSEGGFKSPPIPRAATGSEGCRMAKRFGKSVLLC